MNFIVSGEKDAGKSTYTYELVSVLQNRNLSIEGFLSPGLWVPVSLKRFELLDLRSLEKWPLCEAEMKPGYFACGRYYFNPETISRGERIIRKAIQNRADLIVMDEIGRCELKGKVWDPVLREALNASVDLLMVLANKNLDQVLACYGITDFVLFDISSLPVGQAADQAMHLRTG